MIEIKVGSFADGLDDDVDWRLARIRCRVTNGEESDRNWCKWGTFSDNGRLCIYLCHRWRWG